jgi:hypothetical protein
LAVFHGSTLNLEEFFSRKLVFAGPQALGFLLSTIEFLQIGGMKNALSILCQMSRVGSIAEWVSVVFNPCFGEVSD